MVATADGRRQTAGARGTGQGQQRGHGHGSDGGGRGGPVIDGIFSTAVSANWSPDTFLPLLGHVFTVHVADPAGGPEMVVPLTLIGVTESTTSPGAPRQRPFTLELTGSEGRLPQGTYALVDVGGESFDIFVVPVQPGADGMARYEAVFN